MLDHPSPIAAASHEALVLSSLAAGVVDLHALVRARLGALAAAGHSPAGAKALLWALGRVSPACFRAREVVLCAPLAEGSLDSEPSTPSEPSRLELRVCLHDALGIIDAWVALACARAWAEQEPGAAPKAHAQLSARERATLVAALATGAWPRLSVDAALSPQQAQQRGRARARALATRWRAAHAAAADHPSRQLFVFFGARGLTDGLSPYVRDVGYALSMAAPAALAQRGVHGARTADAYDWAEAVAGADAAVSAERAAIEAEAGIEALPNARGEWIDGARLWAKAAHEDFASFATQCCRWQATAVRMSWDLLAPGLEAASLLSALPAEVPVRGIAVSWPHDSQSWPHGTEARIYSMVADAAPDGASTWPGHSARGPGGPIALPVDLDVRALLNALKRSQAPPAAVVLGAEDPHRRLASARALAAHAAAVWVNEG